MGKGCIVIGAAMLDIVMEIDRIPKSGTDVYAKGQSMMVGGCAYNVADILKHFGVNYTLFAPIGTGMYADFIRKELKKAIVIGNPLMLSPDFPPLHTGRESFPSSGVPSSVTSTF